jgi:mono/diheme cytochrome c family protein
MKAIIGTVLVLLAVEMAAATGFICSGLFNVAATDPHWSLIYGVLESARVRSVKAHAAGLKAPDNLADHKRVVEGTSHFAEHCSSCHSAPGVEAGDAAKGMYPRPPALAEAARKWSPAEMFWMIRNGIKMSGMPAWPDHSDEDIWNIVAFLGQLPKITEQDYANLIKESLVAGGHQTHDGRSTDCAPEHRAAGHC